MLNVIRSVMVIATLFIASPILANEVEIRLTHDVENLLVCKNPDHVRRLIVTRWSNNLEYVTTFHKYTLMTDESGRVPCSPISQSIEIGIIYLKVETTVGDQVFSAYIIEVHYQSDNGKPAVGYAFSAD